MNIVINSRTRDLDYNAQNLRRCNEIAFTSGMLFMCEWLCCFYEAVCIHTHGHWFCWEQRLKLWSFIKIRAQIDRALYPQATRRRMDGGWRRFSSRWLRRCCVLSRPHLTQDWVNTEQHMEEQVFATSVPRKASIIRANQQRWCV